MKPRAKGLTHIIRTCYSRPSFSDFDVLLLFKPKSAVSELPLLCSMQAQGNLMDVEGGGTDSSKALHLKNNQSSSRPKSIEMIGRIHEILEDLRWLRDYSTQYFQRV